MSESTNATLSSPKAAGDSASGKPSSVTPASAPPASAEPEAKGTVYEDATRVLSSLTEAQHKHWQITGELPDGLEVREEAKPQAGENEKTLAELTDAERKTWRETGKLPEPKVEQTAAKTTDEKKPASEKHSLEVITEHLAAGRQAEADEIHTAARNTFQERWNRGNRSDGGQADLKATFDLGVKNGTISTAGGVPVMFAENKQLQSWMNAAQLHISNPYALWKALITDEKFRHEITSAAPNQRYVILSKWDRTYKAPSKVTSAPAPATVISGKSTAPVDQEAAALREGNFTTYQTEANRSEFARRKGGRR